MGSIALAEELLLLAYDDESGKATVSRVGLDLGMAAAVLIELALADRIKLGDAHLVVPVDTAPTGHPIADSALTRVAAGPPQTVASWVQRLRHGLRDEVLADLYSRGVVGHREETALDFITLHRYPALDRGPETEVRSRLVATLAGTVPPSERTAALAALIVAARMEPTLDLPGADRATAHRRLEEMAALAGLGTPGLRTRSADSTVRPSVGCLIAELHLAIGTALG